MNKHVVISEQNRPYDYAASTKAAVETAVAVVGASTYQKRVSDQYAAIETAKDNLLRECVKFGALLTEVG